MENAKTQLADRLKSANNILVTVSRNPSVDQLAACLGLSLLLNKLNKHSVAVFSGQVPSTIEFLKPEQTLEKTTDSLRDFIIALDKDKADKLRYKVEDNVVRIFITPYRTSITEDDLEFSQGDFNVDVVVALGVKQQQDLDEAITAHGRILHDATVASINLTPDGGLGTISWNDPQASSLSELVTDLSRLLGDNLLDNQIATALLTGIVASTDRFSNNKTSSGTMNAGSMLMAAGANQQLVASKLEEPSAPPKPGPAAPPKPADKPNTLNITHDNPPPPEPPKAELPKPQPPPAFTPPPASPPPPPPEPPSSPVGSQLSPGAKLITEPPTISGTLSANTKPEGLDPVTDPMSMPSKEPGQLIDQLPPKPTPTPPPPPPFVPPSTPSLPPLPPPSDQPQTLTDLEKEVSSPHLDDEKIDVARNQVDEALKGTVNPIPAPIQALNAQPLGDELHPDATPTIQPPKSHVLPLGPTPPSSSDTTPAPPVPPPLSPQAISNANKPGPQPPAPL